MPIYAFECGGCGHRFDRLQRLSDPDPTTCPECNAAQVKRRLTAPAFRLVGSGWYETDFKKEGDTKRNLVDKSDTAAPSTETAGKTEAKPAAEPVAKAEATPAAKSEPKSL